MTLIGLGTHYTSTSAAIKAVLLKWPYYASNEDFALQLTAIIEMERKSFNHSNSNAKITFRSFIRDSFPSYKITNKYLLSYVFSSENFLYTLTI